ncbi:MAG: GDP-mannose 4,6-dehydratase [Acidobacteriia bacterium]|nr:GDP-mannose 4,6-dehydratase [Terriglobia bacterium]
MRALITGVTGQDGSYLAELLLAKGYEVYGLVLPKKKMRPGDIEARKQIALIGPRLKLLEGDLTDQNSLDRVIGKVQPGEVYNLAAQSFVPLSWTEPLLTADVTAFGVLRLLEAVRKHCPTARFLQASSSEMFGKAILSEKDKRQTEATPFRPRNPYGSAKVFAHNITVNYREKHGIFACSCICFNHESPRRGVEFVTRKITQHAARSKRGLAEKLSPKLKLGNLDAQRDWGFAGDFVRAMWLMLQQPKPDDFLIATGELHSVREVLDIAYARVGLDWKKYVETDPALVRSAEEMPLCGDASKAARVLGWKPEVGFREMIEMMVDADLAAAR